MSIRLVTHALATLLLMIMSASGNADEAARQAFLTRMDAALASRDSLEVAAMADTRSWISAGFPALGSLKMSLPKAPITRDRNLSDTAVLYRDGDGRSWRLAMRSDQSGRDWTAVIRSSPCPRGGTRFRPDSQPAAADIPRVEIWTVLECWPLPK